MFCSGGCSCFCGFAKVPATGRADKVRAVKVRAVKVRAVEVRRSRSGGQGPATCRADLRPTLSVATLFQIKLAISAYRSPMIDLITVY